MAIDDAALQMLDPGRRVADEIVDGEPAQRLWRRLQKEWPDHAALTPSAPDAPRTPQTPARAPRARCVGGGGSTRWLIPASVAAAGLVAVSIALPESEAYAGWTAYPTGTAASSDSPGARDCERIMTTPMPSGPRATPPDQESFPDLRTVLVEERGVYTLAIARSDAGILAECLIQTSGGGAGAAAASSTETSAPPPADSLAVEIYTTSSYVPGEPQPGEPEDAHSVLAGLVGDEVVGVVVNTPQRGPVRASVADGVFAGWWPWEFVFGTHEAYPDLTFDLELADGTVRHGIPLERADARSSAEQQN